MHYSTFNDAMRARFGTKAYRLSLQSGCTCPNRDGKIATGGCTFCSEGGSGDFAAPLRPIAEQIEEARKRVDAKIPASIAPPGLPALPVRAQQVGGSRCRLPSCCPRQGSCSAAAIPQCW